MSSKCKSAFLLLFALGIVFSVSWKGQDYTTLKPVDETDVHWDIVQMEIRRITKSDPNSPVGNKIEKIGIIDGNDVRSLFPDWKFYGFEYSNYAKNISDKNAVHLALGLRQTLAVPSDSNSVRNLRLYNWGNYNEYEELLKINKISIRDANDANLVWNAFCEIHRKGWKDYKVEKVSDNEWKLGIYEYNQTVSDVNGVKTIVKRTHYSKVTTDPNTKKITEWKMQVETSDANL